MIDLQTDELNDSLTEVVAFKQRFTFIMMMYFRFYKVDTHAFYKVTKKKVSTNVNPTGKLLCWPLCVYRVLGVSMSQQVCDLA